MSTTSPASQPAALQRPLIQILALPGCPNRTGAIALAEQVCAELGDNAEIQVIDVADQRAAERTRSLGSPTIQVDGRDVEPGAEQCVEYTHTCRLYQGEHGVCGLPEAQWVREALRTAQARRFDLHMAAVAAEIDAFLERDWAAEGIGAKLNRLLSGFLETEVLPQAMRAADMGIDPTPLLDVVAAVLRMYADALGRPDDGAD
jgi:hypothetical protein